jgi:hypothetical protein
MKKLVAFVMVLSLGLFCVAGCGKPPEKKTGGAAPGAAAPADEKKAGDKTPAPPEKPADKAPAPPEKK